MKGSSFITRAFLYCFGICMQLAVLGQHEADYWYFGEQAGLHFNAGGPTVLNDGMTNTTEGTASISDAWGNLLFYTDGQQVWNANHNLMPNGTGLQGGLSATQSSLIVEQPDNPGIYYIFTVYHMGWSPGLVYSIVDMSLDAGNGDVVGKNIPLLDPASEKITAYKHSNNRDVWILSHEWGSNNYYSWLLSPAGLSAPTVSSIGAIHGGIPDNAIGAMKFSPDGEWLAAAVYKQNLVELMRFDRDTGQPYDLISLAQDDWAYGLEFSPGSSKLYVSNHVSVPQIVQYDLSATSDSLVAASKTAIGFPATTNLGSMTLAPDGKIYLAARDAFVGVINDPDEAGMASNFSDNAIALPGDAKLSLPNFPAYLFAPNYIESELHCAADSSSFEVYDTYGLDSIVWVFGGGGKTRDISIYCTQLCSILTIKVTYIPGSSLKKITRIDIAEIQVAKVHEISFLINRL